MNYSDYPVKIISAIALHYDGGHTPRITAKGQGLIAEQIIQLAKDNDVPLHEDIPLATALSQIPLGDDIPAELYIAVAEILAFIYTLDEIQEKFST